MTSEEFCNLDFYGKLGYMFSVCSEVIRRLESIVNESAAYLLIEELMDELKENFSIFALDEDFLKEENFGKLFKNFRTYIKEVVELAPLVRSGKAYYGYIIDLLRDLCDISLRTLPNNLRLARFFIELKDNKSEIAKCCNIDEDVLSSVFEKMLENADVVNDILVNNTPSRRKK